MRNILITGGCGFIGSNAVRYFYNKYPDYKIFNLDLLTYAGNPDNLSDIEEKESFKKPSERRYNFVRGDICDDRVFDMLFSENKIEMVINFAAETHVDRSIINVSDFIKTNIGGVRVIIEALRRHKVPRFIQISTDEVYGDVPEGQFTNEESPVRPSNPYSASKASADLIIQAFTRTHAIPTVIVRGSNNYGPYQYPEKLIPLVISNLVEGKKIPIHGNGQQTRSWLHVDDFCSAIDVVAHKAKDFELYNVSGEGRANIEIIDIIAKHLNLDPEPLKDYINDRPGGDFRYAPNSKKIQTDLGWERTHNLKDHLGDVIDWYKNNKDWWQKVKSKREFLDHYESQSKGKWY